jgi:segregation and condensation protein A
MTDETRNPSDTPAQPTAPEDAKREAPSAGREVPAGHEVPAPHAPYEKSAADLRKEDESAFPFSVSVGQVYEGPYDLLLDLVRKQNIDIYDIPIAKITAQFLAYVEHIKASDVDTAGEFIYMSALLIHIKSKMLLPRSPAESPEEAEDPRRELVERLLEHERFRNAAQMLQQKRQLEEATWTNPGIREFRRAGEDDQDIAADTLDLVRVFRTVLERAKNRPILDVSEDTMTVRQMIDFVRRRLMMEDRPVGLSKLLANTRSAGAVIAMFLALLELVRLQAVLLRQDRDFSEIFVKKSAEFEQIISDRLSIQDDWR